MVIQMKTYYEKILDTYNSIVNVDGKRAFYQTIDWSKPIEKDTDAKIIKNIKIDVDLIKSKIVKDNNKEDQKNKKITKEEIDNLKIILGETYEHILTELHEYCDLKEDYYHLVATWIIGTYLHDSFNTYPYLFINAMKGSGKTRLLKLIAAMSRNGDVMGSPTEAVLFRIPKETTLCIDEFEGVLRKGNEGVREMLNACYKKGMKVRRMKKKNTPDGTEMVVEDFEPYKPICLANIWGMEEVLGDRCITAILEKSSRNDVMRIIEDFNEKSMIIHIKSSLSTNLVQLCSFFGEKGYIYKWNKYVKSKYTAPTTLNTFTTQTTETTLYKEKNAKSCEVSEFEDMLEMFNKIDETGINGRNLELFFPLLIIGDFIGDRVFNEILGVAARLTKEKREEEMVESKDIALIEFVSQLEKDGNFRTIKWITGSFRSYLGDDQPDEIWLNTRWVGRALKRLNLIIDKRRMRDGIEVTLAVDKAKDKIKYLK